MPTPLLLPVTPIHTRETTTRLPSGEIRTVIVEEYPQSTVVPGASLRAARVAAGLSLREAALRTGLTARDITNLERGRVTFGHVHERAAYLAALATDTLVEAL